MCPKGLLRALVRIAVRVAIARFSYTASFDKNPVSCSDCGGFAAVFTACVLLDNAALASAS